MEYLLGMPELTLTGLRVVAEVALTGSISAAAERLGYTQSAVSRQVASAEAAAGTALFERHARGVRPTAAGEVLVRHAHTVIASVTAAGQELAGLRDRLAGRVAVGGFPTAMASLIPRAVARVAAEHPSLQVQLVESSTPAQLAAIRRGRLEVAVLATGAGLPDYDLDGLARSELRTGRGIGVAVHESHPFAARATVGSADLAGQRWIVGANSTADPEFGAWPELADPQIAYAARSWPTRLGLVAAGLGITLMPGSAAPMIPQRVHWVPITAERGLGRTTWVVTAPDPSKAADAVVTALLAEAGAG